MTARVKVAMALRRSTRNSLAIMALNVLTRVGRGTGASAIRAATSDCRGDDPGVFRRSWWGPLPSGGGGHSRYSRPVSVRNTVSRLGLSWVASRTVSPAAEPAVTSSPSTPSGSRVKTRT